jgi:hypothetical protein
MSLYAKVYQVCEDVTCVQASIFYRGVSLGFLQVSYSCTFLSACSYVESQKILTMVLTRTIQNHWVSGLRLHSGIINTRKHNVSETGSVSVFRSGQEDPYSVGSSD